MMKLIPNKARISISACHCWMTGLCRLFIVGCWVFVDGHLHTMFTPTGINVYGSFIFTSMVHFMVRVVQVDSIWSPRGGNWYRTTKYQVLVLPQTLIQKIISSLNNDKINFKTKMFWDWLLSILTNKASISKICVIHCGKLLQGLSRGIQLVSRCWRRQ